MQKLIYAFIFCIFLSTGLWSQGIQQVEFGKNRVQYHDDFDEWVKYESDNFITYWYGKGREIGQAAVQIAEFDFNRIQNVLEHRLNDKLQIIVYTDLTDIKQSNIGSNEAFRNTSGETKIVGNKIFIYFNGSHHHLRKQIREGIASVYLNAMLFGSNLQEIVQNAVTLNLPEWFKEGLVAHVGEPWSTELDGQLRDLVLSEDFEGFTELAEEHPKLAGHSLWYFIGENFGRSTVSNLLYLTRINRSIESGFLYVLGTSYEVVLDSWEQYFRRRYLAEEKRRRPVAGRQVEIRNKRNLPYTQLKLSPDGEKLVYVTNQIGKYKIYIHHLLTGERERIFKEGFRNAFQATDYNYPLVAWSPTGQELAILYEKRDVAYLMRYDVFTGEKVQEKLSSQFHRVYSMEYIDPIRLVFSGTVNGYSDIFTYATNTRQTERITRDFWDDLDASVVTVDSTKGILFVSNRPDSLLERESLDSILPLNTFDVFFYNLETESQELVRVTNTPFANERRPVAVDSTYFAYLSDESGIYNRRVAYLEDYLHHYDQIIRLNDGEEIRIHIDSTMESLDTSLIDTILIEPVIKKRAIAHGVTNYQRNIRNHHTAPRAGKLVDMVVEDQQYRIYRSDLNPDTTIYAPPTRFRRNRSIVLGIPLPPVEKAVKPDSLPATADQIRLPGEPQMETPIDTSNINIESYLFQSEFDDPEDQPEIRSESPKKAQAEVEEEEEAPIALLRGVQPSLTTYLDETNRYQFRPARITPYRLEFRTDYVTTRLDNSLLFEGLETFAANPNDPFSNPPPGILLKANFKDLFEDYELEGGVRVPTTFDGTEYFLVMKDKKQRLDKNYAVYLKNERFSEDGQSVLPNVPNRREVNILLGQMGVRYPLDIFRSLRATFTLRRDRITQLATERPTLEEDTRNEQRAGLRLEYVFDNTLDVDINIKNGTRYKFYASAVKKFNLEILDGPSLDFNEGFMGVIGLDARHYQRLLKHSVAAVRVAGATSFGSERMLYFLGGVNNWLFSSQNEDIPISANEDEIAFKQLATNMRGFRFNIRNGTSFALLNTELRVPIFKYMFRRVRSSLLRHFQVVGFFDMGTAWEGKDPFASDNPLNTKQINNGELVRVNANFFRDPVVAGYGVGARTMLFGYFIRLDYGWGIETKRVQDPRLYLSLGYDF